MVKNLLRNYELKISFEKQTSEIFVVFFVFFVVVVRIFCFVLFFLGLVFKRPKNYFSKGTFLSTWKSISYTVRCMHMAEQHVLESIGLRDVNCEE